MIDALVKKIIIYNDKLEIYLNYTDRKRPDDNNDHQVFSFYTSTKSCEIEPKHFSNKTITIAFGITLYV